jgi:hypothetical protein
MPRLDTAAAAMLVKDGRQAVADVGAAMADACNAMAAVDLKYRVL